jgi:single-stranded-DNA-specific exonuclease
MLKAKTRWKVKEANEEKVNLLVQALKVDFITAKLLVNRGIVTTEEAEQFLTIDDSKFHDPFLLSDMDKTVERIEHAIANDEKILVFGDYDADGVSSTSVLISALKEKQAIVDFYIPNRFTEGYGPNPEAFKWAKQEGYKLIITVDTGISAHAEADLAKELGLDLIITDHHEPSPVLPDAFCIIHPKKPGDTYPFKELAGVGVAFKVAHALLGKIPTHLLEYAAIGTIADLVPLVDENRVIASKGIKALNGTAKPGMRALLKVCGLEGKDLSEESIGFSIGPRINAVGRLESADPAVHLLLSKDYEEAQIIAEEIDELNKERKDLVNQMTEEAIEVVLNQYPPDHNKVLIVAKENWNAGVIGIVASRLVEKFYRPVIVMSIDREKGEAKGSARSIEGFDLFQNLSKCRDILPHFGGHTMAAGMTIKIEFIDELRNRLLQFAEELLTDDDFTPILDVDLECKVDDVSIEVIEQMNRLAPFGMGNPKPRVLLKNVSLDEMRKIGSDLNHLKATLQQEGATIDSIGFGCGEYYDHISPIATVSFVGELSINEWNNRKKPQLMIQDLSVEEWQLFDVRGVRNIKQVIDKIDSTKLITIAFNKESVKALSLRDDVHNVIEYDEFHQRNIDLTDMHVVLLDMPEKEDDIKEIIENAHPERIYAVFHQLENHFFSTIPNRDHFKWYYAFLTKQKEFDLNKFADQLAKQKGWSKETIYFMSKVFFELEFVTINDGLIQLKEDPQKRDLTSSKTYVMKHEQVHLENKLCYSSYEELKQWFDQMNIGVARVEEAMK